MLGFDLHHNNRRSRPTGNEVGGVQAASLIGIPVGRVNVLFAPD
jgi:hypothetical protein